MSFRLIHKPIPDCAHTGVPDPRVLQLWLDQSRRPATPPPPRPLTPAEEIEAIRASMGWPNLDLTYGSVTSTNETLPGRAGPIPVIVSRPVKSAGPCAAIVFFHGGGFMGGSTKTLHHPCRLLAELADAVVFNVDYRLAPEHPFPAGLEDCFEAVKAVADAPERWGIDPRRVWVAGDSAGGNLSAACCVLDRREARRRIAGQLLIYPVVDMRSEEQGHLPWSRDEYQVRAFPEFIEPAIDSIRNAGPWFNRLYLQGQSPVDERISPLLHPAGEFPPTLVITAEFDFLRVEGEEFARRLDVAGVRVRAFRYAGMDHAFFDKLGLFPQAADAVAEMAAFVREPS